MSNPNKLVTAVRGTGQVIGMKFINASHLTHLAECAQNLHGQQPRQANHSDRPTIEAMTARQATRKIN